MATTIQISEELMKKLKSMKLYKNDTYEDIIWDLIEDKMELSKETKKEIEKSMKEYKEGKYRTLEEVKKSLNKNV